MNSILGKLVLLVDGAWDAMAARIESTRWYFAAWGAELLIAGAALALVLAVICYVRTTEGLTLRARVLLAALRFVAVLCLVAVASGAVCRISLVQKERPQLLVLVDDSPSMQLAFGEASRQALAEKTLKEAGLQDRLGQSFNVQTLLTSEVLGRKPGDRRPQDLAEGVVRASSRWGGRSPLAQVLVISDGSQIGQASLVQASASMGVPVSALTFGDGSDVRDVLVQSAAVPAFVYHRDRVLVTANVRSFGIEGEVTVRLMEIRGGAANAASEREAASAKVALKTDGSPVPARLEFEAANAGLQRYVIRLNQVAGELTDANNTLNFHLDVRPEKLRVLFVEGTPSWEYHWLRRALESDPAVEFYGLVRLPPDEWFFQGPKEQAGKRPVIAQPKQGFPASIEELSYFDVLILGDIERKVLDQSNRFEMLRDYVVQRGGGLATLGGLSVYTAGNYEDTPLARVLPVQLDREKKQQLINRFNVQLTSRGMMHPVMQLEYDPVKNAKAWEQLPWVEGGNAWRRVKPGATPLLVHPTLNTGYGPRPVSAAWQCGRGRVFSTALDGTWHWAMARETDTDYHKRFWGLVVRWLGGDPRLVRGNTLILENPVCEVGRPVGISTMLRNENGLPITDAEMSFTVSYPAGSKLKVHAASDPASPGWYRLGFEPDPAGDYAVLCECKFADGKEVKSTLEFCVAASREEFLNVRPDGDALTALAGATGGKAALLAKHETLGLGRIPQQTENLEKTVALWQAPGLVILLVVCLGAEWFVRKRRGLS